MHVLENSRRKDRGQEKTVARRHELQPNTVGGYGFFFVPAPEGGEKPKLGGELRREERRLSLMRVCIDRVGTVDDLSEGVFACLPPQLLHDRSRTRAKVM
jgi:hypothetical protein